MAGPLTWQRAGNVNLISGRQGGYLLAVVNTNQTIRHIHCGWTATVLAGSFDPPESILAETFGVGICTVLGGDAAPFPITNKQNQNPPVERWLNWRITRFSVPRPCGNVGYPMTVWSTPEPFEDIDIEAQVINTSLSHQLSVFLNWENGVPFQTDWTVTFSYWASVLTG